MDRQTCTPENPMPKGDSGWWQHSRVRGVGDGEYTVTYECLNCGHTWREELPQ